MVEVVQPDLKWPDEPYPGLRPFRITSAADETLIFYGRNRHKDEILDRLDKQHMVIVTGPSGCGKSSLVLAGVLPVLQAGLLSSAGADWHVITMRPRSDPIDQLCASIREVSLEDAETTKYMLSNDPSALWILANDIAKAHDRPTDRILLVIDQFEEIFGADARADQVDQFVRLIVRYHERPHPLLYIIVTMRSDFLGFCTKFSGLAQTINETQFLTPILGLRELTEAIIRPSEDYSTTLDQPLLDRLLTDMRPGAEYDPDNLALLQHALQWLWRKARQRSGLDAGIQHRGRKGDAIHIDLALYDEAGGLRGILNRHADEVADSLAGDDRAVLPGILIRLAEKSPSGGYRRSPATTRTIAAVTGKPSAVDRVIERLSGSQVEFLETKSIHADGTRDPLVDLCHESLIRTWSRYRAWVDEEEDKVRAVRRIVGDAMHWAGRGRRAEELDHGAILAARMERWRDYAPTVAWADRYPLSVDRSEPLSNFLALAQEYLAASHAAEQAADAKNRALERRARRASLSLSIGLPTLAILSGLIWFAANAHIKEYKANEAAEMSAMKKNEAESKERDKAVEASHLESASFQLLAQDNLNDTRNDAPTAVLWAAQGLDFAGFGSDSVFEKLTYNALQRLYLKKRWPMSDTATSINFSPDSKILVVTQQNKPAEFFDADGKKITQMPLPSAGTAFPFAQVRWSKRGDLIAFSGKDAVSVASVCGIKDIGQRFPACSGWSNAADLQISIPFPNQFTRAILSPDETTLVVQDGPSFIAPGETELYAVDKLKTLHGGEPKPDKILDGTTLAAAFSKDGYKLAVGLAKGGVRIYRTTDYSMLHDLQPSHPSTGVMSLAFDPNDSDVIYSGSFEGTQRWNVKTGKSTPFDKQELVKQGAGPVLQLAMTPDGAWLASSYDRGMLLFRSTRNADAPDVRLAPHGGPVRGFDIGSSGRVASVAVSNVFIWDRRGALPAVESVESIAAQQPTSPANVDIDPDPKHYTVRKGGRVIATFEPPENPAPAALGAEDPTGALFAIADRAGHVYLFRKTSKAAVATFAVADGAPRTWKSLRFDVANSNIVAVSDKSERVAWHYFRDVKSMQEFVAGRIPIVDGKRMELPSVSLCLITPTAPACRKTTG